MRTGFESRDNLVRRVTRLRSQGGNFMTVSGLRVVENELISGTIRHQNPRWKMEGTKYKAEVRPMG
jgi:hypothetical protein